MAVGRRASARLLRGPSFEQDPSPAQKGEACCAAQMFLNSGNGVVFRGALRPWYSEEKREFHLGRDAAKDLVSEVLKAYDKDHGAPPAELFIHARQRFVNEEWDGFASAVDARKTRLVGVRIRPTQDLRLFPAIRRCSGSSWHSCHDVQA